MQRKPRFVNTVKETADHDVLLTAAADHEGFKLSSLDFTLND